MRRNILLTGLIIFVLGVATIAVSFSQISVYNSLETKFTNFNGNEWKSNYINISDNRILTVMGTTSNFSLINASNLGDISALNVSDYAIKPTSGLNIGSEYEKEYFGLSGSYLLVSFGNSTPPISYEVLSGGSTFAEYASLLVIGGIAVLAGIVLMIVGAALRKK